MSLKQPLEPGTMVRPAGSESHLAIGHVEAGEPLHFDGRVYQLVCYPHLGGNTVWSPIAKLERLLSLPES